MRVKVSWPNAIVDDLERHADERLGRIAARAGTFSSGFFGSIGRELAIERRGQVARDRVEQRLHALVLVGRAHEHRREALADARRRGRSCGSASRALLLRSAAVSISSSLYIDSASSMWCASFGGFVVHVGRNLFDADLLAVRAVEVEGLHA